MCAWPIRLPLVYFSCWYRLQLGHRCCAVAASPGRGKGSPSLHATSASPVRPARPLPDPRRPPRSHPAPSHGHALRPADRAAVRGGSCGRLAGASKSGAPTAPRLSLQGGNAGAGEPAADSLCAHGTRFPTHPSACGSPAPDTEDKAGFAFGEVPGTAGLWFKGVSRSLGSPRHGNFAGDRRGPGSLSQA